MIKLENMTPEVYYKQSRDFQFIGRLYDIVLNSVKTNSDLIYNIPLSDNMNKEYLDLLSFTLGFFPKHEYNVEQQYAICSTLAEAFRNKGNINSIIMACNAILNSEGITKAATYEVSQDHTTLDLFIPQELNDISLINDLLIYLLPAGMHCNIIKEYRLVKNVSTEIGYADSVKVYTRKANNSVARFIGSELTEAQTPILKAYKGALTNSIILNPTKPIPLEEGDTNGK